VYGSCIGASSSSSSSTTTTTTTPTTTTYPFSQDKFPFQTPRISPVDNNRLDLSQVSSSGSLTDNDSPKRVSFQSTVKVILIPHLSEYESAGLCGNLWYGDEDITAFKYEAFLTYQQMQIY
jgi:hypothetical protein